MEKFMTTLRMATEEHKMDLNVTAQQYFDSIKERVSEEVKETCMKYARAGLSDAVVRIRFRDFPIKTDNETHYDGKIRQVVAKTTENLVRELLKDFKMDDYSGFGEWTYGWVRTDYNSRLELESCILVLYLSW